MPEVLSAHITQTPGICGGKACIAGHRIRVADIVVWHEMRGYSADEVVDMFPGITLADVYAALAYYHDHRRDIQAELRREMRRANALRPRFPSRLQEKMRA